MLNKKQILITAIILALFCLLNINSIAKTDLIISSDTSPKKQVLLMLDTSQCINTYKDITLLKQQISKIKSRLKTISAKNYQMIIITSFISSLLTFLFGLLLFAIKRYVSDVREEMKQQKVIFEYLYKQLDTFILNLNLLSGFESALENSDEHFFIEDFELFHIDDMSISALKDKLYADKLFSINSAFMRLNKWLEVSERYNHKLVTAAFFEKTINTTEYNENAKALIERVETGYNELLRNAFTDLIALLAEAKIRKERANHIINFLITKNQNIHQDKLNSKINELKQKIRENNSDNNLANELLSV